MPNEWEEWHEAKEYCIAEHTYNFNFSLFEYISTNPKSKPKYIYYESKHFISPFNYFPYCIYSIYLMQRKINTFLKVIFLTITPGRTSANTRSFFLNLFLNHVISKFLMFSCNFYYISNFFCFCFKIS